MARLPSSVRPSVNFCANRFFSQANGLIETKLAHDGHRLSLHPGCAQGQVKGHVIRALFWILGMSYSVIDGLVTFKNVTFYFLKWHFKKNEKNSKNSKFQNHMTLLTFCYMEISTTALKQLDIHTTRYKNVDCCM